MNKSLLENALVTLLNKSRVRKFPSIKSLVKKCARTSDFFSVLASGLLLLASLVNPLHAEEAKVNNLDAIVAVTVNVNAASVNEIAEALVGIGTKKAQAIVDYREQNGPFTDKNQLLNIKGIGQATLDKNRSSIMLN